MKQQPPPVRLAYSIPETAALMGGISPRTVYNRIQSGELKAIRIGNRRLVTHEAILAALAAASDAEVS